MKLKRLLIKGVLSLALAGCALIYGGAPDSLLSTEVFAAPGDEVESGTCGEEGDNLTWTLKENEEYDYDPESRVIKFKGNLDGSYQVE